MNDILERIRNILSSFPALSSNSNSDFTPRKRRLSHVDSFQSKMRRLEDLSMPRCSSPIEDLNSPQSSSKNVFKKPLFPKSKPFLRPSMATEYLEISDDDDIEFIATNGNSNKNMSKRQDQGSSHSSNSEDFYDTNLKKNYLENSSFLSRHQQILQRAKSTLARGNAISKWKKPSNALDESIRLADYAKYKKMIDSQRFNEPVLFNGSSTSSKNDLTTPKSFSDCYKSTLKHFSQPKTISLSIDLTADNNLADSNNKIKSISIDSDSDSDVKIVSQKVVSPINSLKKRLEIEPIVSDKWISQWNANYTQKIDERKKQIEEYQIRRDKFRDINKQNVQFRLEESLKNCLRIQDVIICDEEPEEQLRLPELNENQEKIISNILRPGPVHQVCADKFNLRVTRADLQTLKGLNWLNDEVINFYVSLITERGNGKNPKLPKVHSMNTFFYPKLVSQGYNSLRRWTKKVDIFAQDLIIIPVHLGVHWCLSVIDFRDKTIKYYDSMGNPNPKCLHALLEYLKSEHLDKKKSEYDISSWKTSSVRDIPQQMNGSDCGVFACMYAEFLSRNAKILFTQEHMPYFRKKMVLEIVTGELLMK